MVDNGNYQAKLSMDLARLSMLHAEKVYLEKAEEFEDAKDIQLSPCMIELIGYNAWTNNRFVITKFRASRGDCI